MTMWAPDISTRSGPIYRELADAIADGIETGTLPPGARLPTQREMAEELGVALTTVTRAYAEAERRGLVRGEVGRGTFVRRMGAPGDQPETNVLDLRPNSLLPWPFGTELLSGMSRYLSESDPGAIFGYGPHGGGLRQRAAGAEWIARKGLPTTAEEVVVTVGAQHGMQVALSALTNPGDEVLVEEVTYAGMRSLAHVLGLRLRPLPLDAEGIRPDGLRAACESATPPRVLYCTPTLQNPTATVMSEQRRREIAAMATASGVTVVEDDSYGFILPDVPPLSSWMENAYYIVGTSKPLAPALRVGYLRAPRSAIPRLEAIIGATVYMTSPILANLVAEWLENGTADRVMAWKREQFALRQGIARRVFAGWDYRAHPRSPHGWLSLPEPWTTREFVHQAATLGVHVSPAEDFTAGRSAPAPHAVRLCVGPTPSRAQLESGLGRLAHMLQRGPEAIRMVV